MIRWSAVSLLALAAACGGDEGLSPPADVAGAWSYTVDLGNASLQATCHSTGTVDITLTGNTVHGPATYDLTCTSPVLDFQQAGGGPITGGTVDGTRVKFTDGNGCTFTGTVSGSPPDAIAGDVRCSVSTPDGNVRLTGTWAATRAVP